MATKDRFIQPHSLVFVVHIQRLLFNYPCWRAPSCVISYRKAWAIIIMVNLHGRIFPIVIFGIRSSILGLAIHEPFNISIRANPFATPLEILPEWYLFPTFNLLRILSDKCIGILSIVLVPTILFAIAFGENVCTYQNPFRRPITICMFLSTCMYILWLGIDL